MLRQRGQMVGDLRIGVEGLEDVVDDLGHMVMAGVGELIGKVSSHLVKVVAHLIGHGTMLPPV